MAGHEKVYGICENKCMVEVYPKTDVYKKSETYGKNDLYNKIEIETTEIVCWAASDSTFSGFELADVDYPIAIDNGKVFANKAGMCFINAKAVLYGETFNAGTNRALALKLPEEYRPVDTVYGIAHYNQYSAAAYITTDGVIHLVFYDTINAVDSRKVMPFSITFMRA